MQFGGGRAQPAPPVAAKTASETAVAGDGFDGAGSEPEPKPTEPVKASGTEVHSGHWREDKIGLLMTMTSEESTTDPCPTIPETLRQSVADSPSWPASSSKGRPGGRKTRWPSRPGVRGWTGWSARSTTPPHGAGQIDGGSRGRDAESFGEISGCSSLCARASSGHAARPLWGMEPKPTGRSSSSGSAISWRSSISFMRYRMCFRPRWRGGACR